MRAVKFAGAAVVAVMMVLALVLVVGIPSGFLTSTIASRIESATGYRVSIGGTTKISLWPTLVALVPEPSLGRKTNPV